MKPIKKRIYQNSTPDQIEAIDHIGSHARLLAGPGTGKTKTLTRRVVSLILQHSVEPEKILVLTFTRMAAAQLRKEVEEVLKPYKKELPHVSTLHSFALKQILHNSKNVDALPKPIRIADDWEERYIIQEDLKRILGLPIKDIKKLLNQLSADWETLRIDEQGWEKQFPNAKFLGAWRFHRTLYGETLRAELVYQLKRQLRQIRNFTLDKKYRYILVDEYQDFNACDLSIIRELGNRGAEIFVSGDDDQSIYGFRFADPIGIRQFPELYPNVKRLALEICFRCDVNILKAAEFVANLDPQRLPKPTRPKDGAETGEVLVVNFRDQKHEATGVAKKISSLIKNGVKPREIAILLRSDRNEVISKPLVHQMRELDIQASLSTSSVLENTKEFRVSLSILRLLVDTNDSLALRTLLSVERNMIGPRAIESIEQYAQKKSCRFQDALKDILQNSSIMPRFGKRVAQFIDKVLSRIAKYEVIDDLPELLETIVSDLTTENPELRSKILDYFKEIQAEEKITNISDLILAINLASQTIEQETQEEAVKILTMHQAKGLSFDVCFIVGAEDEFIPGRNAGEREADERRLLYVSMTRARHKLFITYCGVRTGQQIYSGSKSGTARRSLTRFLVDSPIKIVKAK